MLFWIWQAQNEKIFLHVQDWCDILDEIFCHGSGDKNIFGKERGNE